MSPKRIQEKLKKQRAKQSLRRLPHSTQSHLQDLIKSQVRAAIITKGKLPERNIPASALMRERSKRRAELFSLSQSVSAARSQRLLMSLYCCWISKLSKSVGEIVLMVSRLGENAFNLERENRKQKASKVSDGTKRGQYKTVLSSFCAR